MNKFTPIDLELAVREVAAENPGKTNPLGCVNFEDNGDCSCLVGHALGRLGVTKEMMRANGGTDLNGSSVGILFNTFDDCENVPAVQWVENPQTLKSDGSLSWLRLVQNIADGGQTWRLSVAAADATHATDHEGN